MSKFVSTNPSTGQIINTYETISSDEIDKKIDLAQITFETWRQSNFKVRTELLTNVAKKLKEQREELAKMMSLEMGKRISEGLAEIDKCALVCEYYANNSESLLKDEIVVTEAKKSYVTFTPMGVVLAIMPWNFPFWQVFRAAAPAIMSGNAMLLKHASSVPECALVIEKIFIAAGAPIGLFQTLLISGSQSKQVIENKKVRLVSLTGSEEAGMAVAEVAGRNIKKVVLELGGSDPFIVMNDADINLAAQTASKARLIVSGQSCIAAKRFIVHKEVVDEFVKLLQENFENKKIGDPLDLQTEIGPMSSQMAVDVLQDQVSRSVKQGAKLITGGKQVNRAGYYYQPTILTNVNREMTVSTEETFGPVAAIITVNNANEALKIANDSHFGLGSSLWTTDQATIETFVKNIEAGSIFVNSMVKSDPRLPFGGTRFSGFGRELSGYGLKEFTNVKSVWID